MLPVVLISGVGEFRIRVDSKFGVVKREKFFAIFNEKFEAFLSQSSVRERDAAGHLNQSNKYNFIVALICLFTVINKLLCKTNQYISNHWIVQLILEN